MYKSKTWIKTKLRKNNKFSVNHIKKRLKMESWQRFLTTDPKAAAFSLMVNGGTDYATGI